MKQYTIEEEYNILNYYLQLDGMINQDKIYKTWDKFYGKNKERALKSIEVKICQMLKSKGIPIPFAYKEAPDGFKLIESSKYHYINKDGEVLNLKSGKILNTPRVMFRIFESDNGIDKTLSKNKELNKLFGKSDVNLNTPWTEDEIKTITETYLELDGLSNSEKFDIVTSKVKGRTKQSVIYKLSTILDINRNAYKEAPKGFKNIIGDLYMNKDNKVLNIKTGKFLKTNKTLNIRGSSLSLNKLNEKLFGNGL